MKARLLRNSLQSGHVARDYIRLVTENSSCSTADVRQTAQLVHEVLGFLETHERPIPVEPAVPIKSLILVLTESLRGTRNLTTGDEARIDGANLYRGCRVRLRGIPERQFIVHEIYWDYEEVRIKEIGQDRLFYLVPWDCLQFSGEQEE